MDLLGQLLLGIGGLSLMVVVAAFIGAMTVVLGDVSKERQQAKERNKWGRVKWKN